MKIQFQSLSFESADFVYSAVVGTSLTIVTLLTEIEVAYDSEAEALDAQAELNDVLNKADSHSTFSDVLNDVTSTVGNLFGSVGFGKVFGTVKAKAKQATEKVQTQVKSKATGGADEVEQFLFNILSQLEKEVQRAQADEAKTDSPTRKSSPLDDAEAVFGTTRKTQAGVNDVAVSTLSDAELRAAIHEKAEDAIANNQKVRDLLTELRSEYSESEVQQSIRSHKEMIFQVARQNSHLTVNEVFAVFLR